MPITGHRVSDECKVCTRDRTECGNCKYLRVDRRTGDRRGIGEVDNFVRPVQWDQGAEVTLDEPNQASSEPSGTVESGQLV